jgi:hypothetical protein
LILGSAVSSSTPNDFQPSSHNGLGANRRSPATPCPHRRGRGRSQSERRVHSTRRSACRVGQRERRECSCC